MSGLCRVPGKDRITFGEIKVGDDIDVHRGCIYRLGIQLSSRREYDEYFRRWQRQMLNLRPDTILRAGCEPDGGLTGETFTRGSGIGPEVMITGISPLFLTWKLATRCRAALEHCALSDGLNLNNALGIV